MSEFTNLLPTTKEKFAAKNAVANEVALSGIIIKNLPAAIPVFCFKQWAVNGRFTKHGQPKATNQIIKIFATWIILKNVTTSGNIQKYRTQIPYLASICKISVRTLESRLAWLRANGLVKVEHGSLLLCRYEVLKGIDLTKRLPDFTMPVDGPVMPEDILTTFAIEDIQNKQRKAYHKKLNENQTATQNLYNFFVARGESEEDLQDQEYFRQCHEQAMKQAYRFFKPGHPVFELLHNATNANPVIDVKESTYAFYAGYAVQDRQNKYTGKDESTSTSVGALKRRLKAKGLIKVTRNLIESDCRARVDEKVFHHRYDREFKTTFWCLPDEIEVMTSQFFNPQIAF